MASLAQIDAPQALADIDGLRKMLWRVPNEALRKQLETTAAECQALLERAMMEDADVQPGMDCVTKLYEAFEAAKRVPAAQPPSGPVSVTPGKVEDGGSQTATIAWVLAGGAALLAVVSVIS